MHIIYDNALSILKALRNPAVKKPIHLKCICLWALFHRRSTKSL